MIFSQSGFRFGLESSFIVFPCKQSGHVTGIETPLLCLICFFSPLHHSMIRSLQELLDYAGDDIEETFCLNFTVRISVVYSYIMPLKSELAFVFLEI